MTGVQTCALPISDLVDELQSVLGSLLTVASALEECWHSEDPLELLLLECVVRAEEWSESLQVRAHNVVGSLLDGGEEDFRHLSGEFFIVFAHLGKANAEGLASRGGAKSRLQEAWMQNEFAITLLQRVLLDHLLLSNQQREELDHATEIWSCVVATHLWPLLSWLPQWTLLTEHEVARLGHEAEPSEEVEANSCRLGLCVVFLGCSGARSLLAEPKDHGFDVGNIGHGVNVEDIKELLEVRPVLRHLGIQKLQHLDNEAGTE